MAYNTLIHAEDRAFILGELAAAPDAILVKAYSEWASLRAATVHVRETVKPNTAPITQNSTLSTIEPAAVAPKPERKNVNPGGSTLSKIGTATTAALLHDLEKGVQPKAKFNDHLKLLWERGTVCWDGTEWYLPEN